jgi:hypothetical protein
MPTAQHASSLGLFFTRDTYQGHNGYSLRLDGLDAGFNDAAMNRAIVMHGAAYVDADNGRRMGLGRSWGCPALRKAVAKPIIDVMKDGQFVFSYYPEQAWLARSALAKCAQARLASEVRNARPLAWQGAAGGGAGCRSTGTPRRLSKLAPVPLAGCRCLPHASPFFVPVAGPVDRACVVHVAPAAGVPFWGRASPAPWIPHRPR